MKTRFLDRHLVWRFASRLWVRSVVLVWLSARMVFAQAPVLAPRSVDAIWDHPGEMSDPAVRAEVVGQLRLLQEDRKAAAVERARDAGLPIRDVFPDGRVREIADWDGDTPLYFITQNANAAISTGANLLRAMPFVLDGSGWTVGVWDGGAVRATHRELTGRVRIMDGAPVDDHATHVAGTIGASGVSASARGMAVAVGIDSYDWNNDASESTARGASYGGEPDKLYLSNHSYGYISGWLYMGPSATPRWIWYGSGTTAAGYEDDFGRYNAYAREIDGRLYNLPYYSIFWSAGNDRTDNPVAGESVALTEGGTVRTYDAASHPPGDGTYKNGYDTIGYYALGKNVITVGSVNDAVTSGQRDVSQATVSAFSSWGPADDGRIKPDLMANGATLYSPIGTGDANYATYSGTSMAAPNAAGTAVLLHEWHTRHVPGAYLRASTLKGLLIHTADDLGTPGPDYRTGWGLINGRRAAEQLLLAATNAILPSLIERTLTAAEGRHVQPFVWDGVSPIRATLCWIDPAGSTRIAHDDRTRNLVNDLNLHLVDPNGNLHLPFVMPFVGVWTTASMAEPATTGTNTTDTVEQVLVTAPETPGLWQAVVSFSGTLVNNQQPYALLLSGAGSAPPEPAAVTPDLAFGPATLTVSGQRFDDGAVVFLDREGFPSVIPDSVSRSSTEIVCWLDASRLAQGVWTVRVVNADGLSGAREGVLTVAQRRAEAFFDDGAPGWTASANIGSNLWSLSSGTSHTAPTAWFAPGLASRNTDNLISPVYRLSPDVEWLRLRFWHTYNTEIYDGCVLELSPDGGTNWKAIGAVDAGWSFVRGGYTSQIAGKSGNPNNRAQLVNQPAWTGSNGAVFSLVEVALDPGVYAGSDLRVRWRLSTDASVASEGWRVDSFGLYQMMPFRGTLMLVK